MTWLIGRANGIGIAAQFDSKASAPGAEPGWFVLANHDEKDVRGGNPMNPCRPAISLANGSMDLDAPPACN